MPLILIKVFITENIKPGVGINAQQRDGTSAKYKAVRYQNAVAKDLYRLRLYNKLIIRNGYAD